MNDTAEFELNLTKTLNPRSDFDLNINANIGTVEW